MPALEIKLPKVADGRIDAIDELKGVAILLVLLYHAGGVLVWRNLLHGDMGVDLFVILSGVGIALSARSETSWATLRRRLMRVFPAYWVVLTVFLLADTHFLEIKFSAFNIVVHYLGIHACFGDFYGFGINDSFWFVTLIGGLYVIYAVLQPVLSRPDHIVLWGGVVSAVVAFAYFLTGQAGCFGHLALRVPGFFGGLLIGALLRNGRIEIAISPALAAGLLILIYLPYTHGIVFFTGIAASTLVLGYIVLWRQKAPAELVASTSRYLRFFGTYSLEIFLIHQPLIREYNFYIQGRFFADPSPPASSLIIGMLVGLGATLLLSVELHRLLDRLAAYARKRKGAA
jgi:peptidoglycan/LPS O-acetylase OafA/YrhL